ncbi:MAG: hypothetical protein AB8I08_05445 [Sandaracinaceae bacterium]
MIRVRAGVIVLLGVSLSLLAACDEDPSPDAGPMTDAGTGPGQDSGTPGVDAGPLPDAGPTPDSGLEPDAGPPPPSPAGCEARSAAILAETGTTISVSPAGDGQVMADGATRTLRQVVSGASDGDTILLADGTYTLPEAGDGSFSGLYFTTPNVTMRSASGDASAVIIDSAYRGHGGQSASITVDAPGVTLASFTVRRAVFHLIHLWENGDDAVIHDVALIDGGQQFLKASPGDGRFVDDVEVSCSRFSMTDAGRDNVWGYGSSDGSTTCYTGGIDTHNGRDWVVHDSSFFGIYCDATGVDRPAHGRFADARGGMTYQGGLAEHAIHFWDSPDGSGHIVERNRIVDCGRGIGIGLRDPVYGTVVRNNTVSSRYAGSREHDVGIIIERGRNVQVDHNTVFFSSPDAYTNRIEIRWDTTQNVDLRNNLTNGLIRMRNGATANEAGNMTDADASWFIDATNGDLHLSGCDAAPVGAATSVPSVTADLDGDTRDSAVVGADDC